MNLLDGMLYKVGSLIRDMIELIKDNPDAKETFFVFAKERKELLETKEDKIVMQQ